MNTLYEISQAYQDFLFAVESGEIPEEAIADTLEGLDGLLEEKADNIACLIKSLLAESAAIKLEEQSLAERRRSKESKAEGMKRWLSESLIAAGKTKVETPRNVLSFRKSTSVHIIDESEFLKNAPKEYLTVKDPTINRTEIGKALKAGLNVLGAELSENMNLQVK